MSDLFINFFNKINLIDKLWNLIMRWQLYQFRKKVYGMELMIPVDFYEKYTLRYCRLNLRGTQIDTCGRAWIMFYLDQMEKDFEKGNN